MANQDHLSLLRQGVEHWNPWRAMNPAIVPDLAKANLRLVNLRGANLNKTNLDGTNLRDANLKDTVMATEVNHL